MVSRTQGIKSYHCPWVLDDYKELQAHRQKCIPASGLYMCTLCPHPHPHRNVRKEVIFSHMQSHLRR